MHLRSSYCIVPLRTTVIPLARRRCIALCLCEPPPYHQPDVGVLCTEIKMTDCEHVRVAHLRGSGTQTPTCFEWRPSDATLDCRPQKRGHNPLQTTRYTSPPYSLAPITTLAGRRNGRLPQEKCGMVLKNRTIPLFSPRVLYRTSILPPAILSSVCILCTRKKGG